MQITFMGATGTVTGSKYLLDHQGKKILVDCGLFQGLKELRLKNWAPFPIDPAKIDAVVLTHAHIDHTGYLPLLGKNGFTGPIYCSRGTYALCQILLPDSAFLQEEEANRANKYGYSKHHPAKPLYTREDADLILKQFIPIEFNRPLQIADTFQVTWLHAGHIIGASHLKIETEESSIVFSGDLGRLNDPVMRPPSRISKTDYLVLESTYGNRSQPTQPPEESLARIIHNTYEKKGTVLIPAFAVGRAQMILYYLYQLKKQKKIPSIPIYLDSPMSIDATNIMQDFSEEIRLSAEMCKKVCAVAHYVHTQEESKKLDESNDPKIIISASGMATGGRILHHIKTFGPYPENTILFAGYQAIGTRGADMLAGKKLIKLLGLVVPIEAQVDFLPNLSAHADQPEILTWLKNFEKAPKQVYITHGEPAAATELKREIERTLGWHCVIPSYLAKIKLN
jgi:metallo-beta-lactamase family protein